MDAQTLTVGGLLALLVIAMLILAGLALTLRGFQTLNATIVSLLTIGLHQHTESHNGNGGNLRSNIEDGGPGPDPPPAFGDPPIDPAPPLAPPPSPPPSRNGRRGV